MNVPITTCVGSAPAVNRTMSLPLMLAAKVSTESGTASANFASQGLRFAQGAEHCMKAIEHVEGVARDRFTRARQSEKPNPSRLGATTSG